MKFRPILLFFLMGASPAVTVDYITAFRELQNKTSPSLVWPTPKSNASLISSTFSPRQRISCGCYDFHRGVDLHGEEGDDVVAIYNGRVERLVTYSDGGDTIVIEHTPFENNVTLDPTKHSTTTSQRWFTLYMHLSARYVTEGQVVMAGDVIGAVGMTGK